MPPKIREILDIAEDEEFRIWSAGRVDATLFARGIAKIACCHAVLRFGLDGFRPLALPDVILGTCPAVSYFVGAPLSNPPPPQSSKVLHVIQHSDLTSKEGLLKLHLVSIRLFASSAHKQHGMPIYHVIVGSPALRSSR
jgi:hypothetical protein